MHHVLCVIVRSGRFFCVWCEKYLDFFINNLFNDLNRFSINHHYWFRHNATRHSYLFWCIIFVIKLFFIHKFLHLCNVRCTLILFESMFLHRWTGFYYYEFHMLMFLLCVVGTRLSYHVGVYHDVVADRCCLLLIADCCYLLLLTRCMIKWMHQWCQRCCCWLKKEKISIQRKATSFTVVFNRHSPKPDDYFLSVLKKWSSQNIPLYLKVSSLTH